ncbi:MAG: efflux RND transporter permease subunit [Candidatus Latescibacteria bacterium]|nr:efflux RND transporter permease subunit [Candidatus Latescibacterota bacterium]
MKKPPDLESLEAEQLKQAEEEETKRDFSHLFEMTTTRPVAILMIVIAVVVFGLVSYQRLSLNLMPDISYPTLTVRTEYPGAAPEEVEHTISRPIEQALGVVNQLVSIHSISKAGLSDVILEFEWGTDMNFATQDVREKLDRFYVEDAERPLILRYDPTMDPIMRLGVYGDLNLFALRRIAEDEIKRELEGLPGVAAVKVKGGLEEQILVELNERQMATLDLNIATINARLAQENVNLAGGQLREGQTEYIVRTLNEFQDIGEIASLVIGRKGNVDIRLKDVANIRRTHKEREVITRVKGRECVEIEIYKEADANLVAVAQAVKRRVGSMEQLASIARILKVKYQQEAEAAEADTAAAEPAAADKKQPSDAKGKKVKKGELPPELQRLIASTLPKGVQIEILSDPSTFIQNAISEVKNTALLGGLLAIFVLYLFLRRINHTLIISVAIPVSIVATFAGMYLFDVSLNIMSLGGLALGVGMLVDNSIVVLESIFRCREEGDSIQRASIRGVSEVGGAVFASTLTTIAVFFPIVFVQGIAGQVFGDMSLTVVFALLTSLVVALFFIPMLASRRIGESEDGAIRKLTSADILRIKSLSDGDIKGQKTKVTRGSFWTALARFPHFLFEWIWRTAAVLGTILSALLKTIFLLLLTTLYPVITGTLKVVERIARSERTRRIPLVEWAENTHVGRLKFFQRVWETILCFRAPQALGDSLSGFWNWLNCGKLVWKILKAPVSIPAFLYFYFRFFIQLLLEFLGKVILCVTILIMLLTRSAVGLIGMVLRPLFLPLLALFDLAFGAISRAYPRVIGWSLRNKALVIGTAALLFALCWFGLIPRLGSELIPQVHQGEFNVDVTMPIGTPLEGTDAAIRPLERIILREESVDQIATTVGAEKTTMASSEEGEHTGKITVRLARGGDLKDKEERVIGRLRKTFGEIPRVKTDISLPALFSFKTPIEVEIKGFNLQTLSLLSRKVESELGRIPGLYDVKSNIQRGHPEIQIVYNRERLSDYGLNLRDVATLVRNKVQGRVPTEFRDRERKIDILVRIREQDKATIHDLKRLTVNPGARIAIPLSAVADIRLSEGPSEIRRIDQQRAALITANISGRDLASVTRDIERVLEDIEMPSDFTFDIAGQRREMQTSIDSLTFALALAIFLVYVVMASQFESLLHPLVIMFTIPLALIGVVVVLYAFHISLSIVVFIGLIMLAGIVVNNAIVLIDYINHLRKNGMDKVAAIIQGGQVRLRPILMTTATTVLGLLPMALGLGEGAEIRTPMALTVIAGLISSTVLTLIVIPTVYAAVDRR